MRKSNAEQLGAIINQFMREEGLETPLNQYRIIEAWKNTVGKSFAKYTDNVFIKNQTLYIKLRSSVVKQELTMCAPQITRNLNDEVGAQVIANTVFI